MIGSVFFGNMHGIGVAKEVVHVAENLLISAYKEHTQVVGFILLQRMHRQRMGVMTVGSEIGNLTI